MDSSERRMNPFAMTIINPRKEYWPGIEPATYCSQVCKADGNFKLNENGRKFSKRAENTVGKLEIAHYEQFLLFLVFLKDFYCRNIKTRACLGKG